MENKRLRRQDTNKGITLIALVITIIVMLILVAVTITMAVNGGLFEYAQNAGTQTNGAIANEQILANGGVTIGDQYYNSINEFVNSTPAGEEGHNWTRTGDDFKCSHCDAEYTMGDIVNYERANAGETVTAELTAQMSGLDKYYEDNEECYPESPIVNVDGDQIIEAQDVNWVILGIEDTNKDGIYETLLITTETDLWTVDEEENWYGVNFYGAAGYNNAVGEINRICRELYSNSEYGEARGMTIEDVNAALNYEPVGGLYYDVVQDKIMYTNGLTTKLSELEDIYNRYVYCNNCATPDGVNTSAALGEYEVNGYVYPAIGEDRLVLLNPVNGNTQTITEIERDTIFGLSDPYFYWLASRGVVAADYDNACAEFGVGSVGGHAVCSYTTLYNSNGFEDDILSDTGLRPVVSLKSKLPAKS